jgi:serpin B
MFKFIQDFHKQITKDKNLVYSPLSIVFACSMLCQGTSGRVRRELEKYFSLKPEEIKKIMDMATALKISNAIYVNNNYSDVVLKESYKSMIKKYYDGIIKKVPFNDATVKDINKWIEGKTGGLIKDFVDKLRPLDIIFIVNCIYFKEKWKNEFDKTLTQKSLFGNKYQVDMMNKYNSNEQYGKHQWNGVKFLSLTLDYKVPGFRMIFLKPDDINKLEGVLFESDKFEGIDGFVKKITDEQSLTELNQISIPKFKVRVKQSLLESFKKIGVIYTFEFSRDYIPMLHVEKLKNDVRVRKIIHEAVLIVDEEGTEAAAVTGIWMELKSKPVKIYNFILDKPFIALLCFNDIPVFIVKYINPPEMTFKETNQKSDSVYGIKKYNSLILKEMYRKSVSQGYVEEGIKEYSLSLHKDIKKLLSMLDNETKQKILNTME